MLKFARYLSIFFQPLFITFYNFLFLLLISGTRGAILGFDITLFFLCIVVLPMFYTAAVLYGDNKEFKWANVSEMLMNSIRKLLVYTLFYVVIVLLIVISLNKIFLGNYKPMFATLIMGFAFCMMASFILLLINLKNSLHTIAISFFVCFAFIFSQQVPGFDIPNPAHSNWYLYLGIANVLILIGVIWARLYLKVQPMREMLIGTLIGILAPIVLSLLTYVV